MTSLFQRLRSRNKSTLEVSYSRSTSQPSPPGSSAPRQITTNISPPGRTPHQTSTSLKSRTPPKPETLTKVPHLNLGHFRNHVVEKVNKITRRHNVIVAAVTTDTVSSSNPETERISSHCEVERVAISSRVGKTAYTEWLNEINVYLLPNFENLNILSFLFAEKCYRTNSTDRLPQIGELLGDLETEEERKIKQNRPESSVGRSSWFTGRRPKSRVLPELSEEDEVQHELEQQQYEPKPGTSRSSYPEDQKYNMHQQHQQQQQQQQQRRSHLTDSSRSSDMNRVKNRKMLPEFWVLTDFTGCQYLRDHLRQETLSWNECLDIAIGIASGLHFLHENNEYQRFNTREAVDRFIGSTNGALKKVSFVDQRQRILMEPPLLLAVIHRDLSSLNVVLCGPNKVAKLCNFGQAYIQHPFQPINHNHVIDKATKFAQLTSPYSPPEVLQEKGHLTLTAMKCIDMYAFGIILWEMLSRTRLPIISQLMRESQRLRLVPVPYKTPFEDELAGCPKEIKPQLMEYMVCEERIRPPIAKEWQEGKYSNLLVQTIRELWDQDFEARLHSTTVLGRLCKLREPSRLHDVKNKHGIRESMRHNRAAWRDKILQSKPSVSQQEQPIILGPNIRFEAVPPVG